MANFPLHSAIRELPAASDASAAMRGAERWRELASSAHDAALCEFVTAFADTPDGAAVLDAVFGNSPFLTQCLLQDPETLRRFAAGDPHDALAWACEPVGMAAMAIAERA